MVVAVAVVAVVVAAVALPGAVVVELLLGAVPACYRQQSSDPEGRTARRPEGNVA